MPGRFNRNVGTFFKNAGTNIYNQRTMRKIFHKIHLWLSLPAGILISVICLSGAALVFETDITQALSPHLYRTETPENGTFLKPSELAARIHEQTNEPLTLVSLQMPGTPDGACMASFKESGKKKLSVNPYTGEVNGWTKSYPFFQTMRKLHRWFMDSPARKGEKSAGKVAVGISTFLMAFILVTGIAVWIPKNARALRNRLKVSCNKGWKRFFYDTHVSLGFYAAIPLLVMALTGLTWSFGWYRNAAYSLFGGNLQTDSSRAKGIKEKEVRELSGNALTTDYRAWDRAYGQLLTRYPEHKSVTLSDGQAQIVPDRTSLLPKSDRVRFDMQNGEIKEIIPYSNIPRSQTLKGWFYAFHTGSWGGTATKILYFAAALVGGILPLSGYWIWLKRKRLI